MHPPRARWLTSRFATGKIGTPDLTFLSNPRRSAGRWNAREMDKEVTMRKERDIHKELSDVASYGDKKR